MFAKLLWIKQQLDDFGVLPDTFPFTYDNNSAINMAKSPRKYKRNKHIDVRHHFLKDNVEKQNVAMKFYKTEDQLEDICRKTLSKECFIINRMRLEKHKIT